MEDKDAGTVTSGKWRDQPTVTNAAIVEFGATTGVCVYGIFFVKKQHQNPQQEV